MHWNKKTGAREAYMSVMLILPSQAIRNVIDDSCSLESKLSDRTENPSSISNPPLSSFVDIILPSRDRHRPRVARVFYRPSRLSVTNSPFVEPFQMSPLLVFPLHSKDDSPEEHKQPNHKRIDKPIDRPLRPPILSRQGPRHPVKHEASRQDGKIQCRVIVVHVRDPCHGHERQIVQEPASDRIKATVVNVVDVGRLKLVIASLPADQIPGNQTSEDEKGQRRAPVNCRIA